MSDLKINIPHKLSAGEATDRIKKLLTNLRTEHKDLIQNASEEWEGSNGQFGFSVKGFDLAGTIRVSDSAVDINAKLPFALSFFKGAISKVITDKANELLV